MFDTYHLWAHTDLNCGLQPCEGCCQLPAARQPHENGLNSSLSRFDVLQGVSWFHTEPGQIPGHAHGQQGTQRATRCKALRGDATRAGVALLLALLLTGCSTRIRVECITAPEDRESVADRIIQCTQAGNPYSDEEGEDLVAQCDKSVRAIYCTRQVTFARQGFDYAEWLPCSAAATDDEREACASASAVSP